MLLNTSRESDLLSDLGTCGRSKLDFGKIALDGKNAAASGRRADVDKEELVLNELGDFCLLLVICLAAEQPTQQEERNFQF